MPNSKFEENRRFRRINFVEAVQVTSDDIDGVDEVSWQAECRDISMLGMLLDVPDNFPLMVGTPFEVKLTLSEDVIIEMPCTLVHVNGSYAGFRAEMMSIESLTSLRRLLEQNLQTSVDIERELSELITKQEAL